MIANILKQIRESKHLTQQDVANGINVNSSTYKNYEYGRREPDLKTVSKIADFYGVTTDYLLGREPLPDPFADLELNENIEDDVMAKFTSLSPEIRAVVLDVIAQLGDIIRKQQNRNKTERITITAEELEDQWKAEQEAKNKDTG